MKKLFVFDLDFTLWNTGGVWCDCTQPPYSKENGEVIDASGNIMKLYPDTLRILNNLRGLGIQLAVASRTNEPTWARQLMKLLEIEHYFEFTEIYPASKLRHLSKISSESGVPYSEIVFFDDEHRNIVDARSLGIEAVFVQNGINMKLIEPYI